MELFKDIVLILHFVGLAMIIGGALAQVRGKSKTVNRTMLDGAYTQIVTGLGLVGLEYALGEGDEIDNAKIGVKLAIVIAIAVIGIVNKKKTSATAAWATVLTLALANVAIAVIWH